MTDHFSLFVPGIPVPQGSKSVTRSGRMFEANKKTGPWRATVKAAAEQHIAMTDSWVMLDGPLSVHLVFWMPRPRSHFGSGRNADRVKDSAPAHPHSKPDLDKLVRAVADALTSAEVWADDCRMVQLTATKRYASPNDAGVAVSVRSA